MDVLIQRSDLRTKQVDGETLVLDDQDGLIHQLNETASFIWEQCDGESSKAQIIDRFAEQFELTQAIATRDVTAVLGQLRELNLLQQ